MSFVGRFRSWGMTDRNVLEDHRQYRIIRPSEGAMMMLAWKAVRGLAAQDFAQGISVFAELCRRDRPTRAVIDARQLDQESPAVRWLRGEGEVDGEAYPQWWRRAVVPLYCEAGISTLTVATGDPNAPGRIASPEGVEFAIGYFYGPEAGDRVGALGFPSVRSMQMANLRKRRASNVDGEFFVDSTCIDCGTCRWMAPASFDERGGASRVYRQPAQDAQITAALRAAVACPVGAIGVGPTYSLATVAKRFPVEVEAGVFHCGFHHRSSFGAASYLIVRPQGNVLIDSPRFTAPLIKRLQDLGGVTTMFLTHRDDVGDHDKFADRFGCERILHEDDVTPATAGVERRIMGRKAQPIDDDLTVIPVPGHTKGSQCLLYRDRFLFTGDHLAWSRSMKQLYAFRGACWYDWRIQVDSMQHLAEHGFEHVLPGHGAPCRFDSRAMREEMKKCVAWMSAQI